MKVKEVSTAFSPDIWFGFYCWQRNKKTSRKKLKRKKGDEKMRRFLG